MPSRIRTVLLWIVGFTIALRIGIAAAPAQPYSGYVNVTSNSVAATCGTFYIVDTISIGSVTINLPSAASCPAGNVVAAKKALKPGHGGFLTMQPVSGQGIEARGPGVPLQTEKNGAMITLVSNGVNEWTLVGDFWSLKSSVFVNHHSITTDPWAINAATMGGEILGVDTSSAGGPVAMHFSSLSGAVDGYVPNTYLFANLASGSNFISPQPQACLTTAPGITIAQAANAHCMDAYGETFWGLVDGNDVKIIGEKRQETEVQTQRCSGIGGPNIVIGPYGVGMGIALPRTSSGIMTWKVRNIPVAKALTMSNPGYGVHVTPGGTYEAGIWEIPQWLAVNDRAGTLRIVMWPAGQIVQRDGVYVNSQQIPTDFANQNIAAYAVRRVCRVVVDANGNIASLE